MPKPSFAKMRRDRVASANAKSDRAFAALQEAASPLYGLDQTGLRHEIVSAAIDLAVAAYEKGMAHARASS